MKRSPILERHTDKVAFEMPVIFAGREHRGRCTELQMALFLIGQHTAFGGRECRCASKGATLTAQIVRNISRQLPPPDKGVCVMHPNSPLRLWLCHLMRQSKSAAQTRKR